MVVALQFVKDTELEGGNVGPAMSVYADLMLEALSCLPGGVRTAKLNGCVEKSVDLLRGAVHTRSVLNKLSGSMKKLLEAMKWYRNKLSTVNVGVNSA